MPWTDSSFAVDEDDPQGFCVEGAFGIAVKFSFNALKRNREINAPKSSDPVELKWSPSLP